MLKAMRKKENVKAVMWILAIILIPAFVLWGGGAMLRERAQGQAGKVFNRKISLEKYLESWEAVRNQAILIYGKLFEQIAQYLDLDSQAWDRLILLEEAKRQKIKVKDEELIDRLRNLPLFQKDGKFDPQIYDWVLKYYLRTNPLRFEEEMRASLKISKLVEKIYNEVKLSEEELKEEYVKENEKAKFSYFIIETEDFLEKVEIKDEKELIDYYTLNKDFLRNPETVKVEYIFIDPQMLEKEINISEEEIKEYFESQKEEFALPPPPQNQQETPQAVPEPALTEEIKGKIKTQLTSQRAMDKVEEIRNELIGKLTPQANLEELAKKYGVLFKVTDYFSLDTVLPEIGFNLKFYNYAFRLKPGEISDPIEIKNGYLFLRVKEKRPPYVPEFNEAKDKVEELLKKEKANLMAKEKAEKVLEELKTKNWDEVAKELNLTPVSTEFITRSSYIPRIGKSEKFTETGFSLNPKQIAPSMVETERGFVLLRLEERIPVKEEDFEKDKEAFREKTLAKKQQEHFEIWFKELKRRANLQSNIDKLKAKFNP
ncbi:MAG: SurA N-terminal domain-containing protein [Candidatus Omnitrophica bacterium]|nr:SurA N-terminal domain-containing protein [Candidatus Omnitrophota bacterium]